jgi:hypothetical protein
MSVHRLKVAILPLDVPCSGSVTHLGEILTTGKSHVKKPEVTLRKDEYLVHTDNICHKQENEGYYFNPLNAELNPHLPFASITRRCNYSSR